MHINKNPYKEKKVFFSLLLTLRQFIVVALHINADINNKLCAE